MKKNTLRTIVVGTALVAAVSVAGTAFAFGGYGRTSAAAPNAAAPGDATCVISSVPSDADPSDLTPVEIADLQYLREEEKLAHDVYTALYEQWGLRTFSNIAASEQRHTDAVEALLAAYGVEDDVDESALGQFEDDKLQALYDELISRGSESLASAIEVGILVEKVDIADIDEQIANTSNDAILQVYENLRFGSENHLSAFSKVYERFTDNSAEDVTL
jgi:hypothetical protein